MRTEISNPGRRAVTVTLAASMLLASLGTSIANIALPTLTAAFDAPFHRVQWVVVAYLATLTVSVVAVGRLGDIHGLRRMFLVGLGLFSVAALLGGLAPTLWLLVAARGLQGVGAAFLMTLALALLRETASEERLGRAMGLMGTMSALGTALGPSLGGVLIAATGWRGIFLVQVPLALLALALAVVALPRETDEARPRAASLRAAWDTKMVPDLAANLLVAAVMMTTLVVGPFYLGFGLGLNALSVGLVMSAGPLISIFAGIPSGRAVDAWGSRRILAIGLIALVAGAFLLAVLPPVLGVAGYVLGIAVLTPGYQLFQAANNTAVLSGVAKDRRGTVSGLLGLSRNAGLILGASAMGAVFALGVGTGDFAQVSADAIIGGARWTFLVAGALMVVAFTVAFARSARRPTA